MEIKISESIAWVHKEAEELPTTEDLVQLKYCLKNLIEKASGALEIVRDEIRQQR